MSFENYSIPQNNINNPCRAYAILAHDAALAVILRRGPSDWVQLIRWQTSSDIIEHGQWFKGRIYERRCDLSPDGNLFLYFARKQKQGTMNDQNYTYAWTAVSRPPYFTALALWPKGNSWNGGGVFDDNTTIRLNHDPERMVSHPNHEPKGLTIIPDFQEKGEDTSIYPKLLKSHGWELIQDADSWHEETFGVYKPNQPVIWRKTTPRFGLSLYMHLTGINENQFGDDLILHYAVTDEHINHSYTIENATWADWDQQGRLVYISKGLLLGQQFKPELKLARVIADLNPHTPSSVITPDWATKW